jgi:hypothetical protein
MHDRNSPTNPVRKEIDFSCVKDHVCIKRVQAKMKSLSYILVTVLSMLSAMTSAVTLNITGVYEPDLINPGANRFKITSGNSLCDDVADYISVCGGKGIHLFSINNLPISLSPLTRPLDKNSDAEEWMYFKVETAAKEVVLTNTQNQSLRVSSQISHFGGAVEWPNKVWFSGDRRGAFTQDSRCDLIVDGAGTSAPRTVRKVFKMPSGGECAIRGSDKQTAPLDNLQYYSFNIGFVFTALDAPISLAPGTYTGTQVFTLGSSGADDFTVGNNKAVAAANTIITVNFNFKVTHYLNVQPVGGLKVSLQPNAGWAGWLATKRIPEKLSGSSQVLLSTSAPFRMKLLCQYPASDGCALKSNSSDERVAVNTLVTLPLGVNLNSTRVLRHRLRSVDSPLFIPAHLIASKPANLDFEIEKEQLNTMLNNTNNSRRYSGSITVVWEAASI